MIMCFDHVELTSREYGKISHTPVAYDKSGPGMPPLRGQIEVCDASGPYGTIIHRQVTEATFGIWHTRYALQRKMTLLLTSGQPALTLYFALRNNMTFHLGDFGEDTIMEQQYNILFVPRTKCEYTLRKNEEYELFGIHYRASYLERWEHLFSPLKEFLFKAANGIPAMISSSHLIATAEMQTIIGDMLRGMHEDPLRKMWLEARGLELLEAALRQISEQRSMMKRSSLSSNDLERIKESRTYLLGHLDHHVTLKSLARQMGTNTFKLKRGFKVLYGVTVFEFLREERMQKASEMLRNTDMPVYGIATAVGYRNHANFTAAFKKRFGHSPRELRAEGSEGQ